MQVLSLISFIAMFANLCYCSEHVYRGTATTEADNQGSELDDFPHLGGTAVILLAVVDFAAVDSQGSEFDDFPDLGIANPHNNRPNFPPAPRPDSE